MVFVTANHASSAADWRLYRADVLNGSNQLVYIPLCSTRNSVDDFCLASPVVPSADHILKLDEHRLPGCGRLSTSDPEALKLLVACTIATDGNRPIGKYDIILRTQH